MFHQLVVSSAQPATHKRWTVAFSATLQTLLLGILILAPLVYTEALPDAMLRTLLIAPPAPTPRLAPEIRVANRPRVMALRNIVQPAYIPSRVFADTDAPPVAYVDDTAVPGGIDDALLNTPVRPPTQPPAPARESRPPVPIGGAIEEASLVHKVVPEYPVIAIRARVSGTVVLHAIIDTDGTVKELSYISGPPLLISVALNAVKQWRYTPTLLNGMPVEVDTTIQVVFNLAN